jgi:hypothetical protein
MAGTTSHVVQRAYCQLILVFLQSGTASRMSKLGKMPWCCTRRTQKFLRPRSSLRRRDRINVLWLHFAALINPKASQIMAEDNRSFSDFVVVGKTHTRMDEDSTESTTAHSARSLSLDRFNGLSIRQPIALLGRACPRGASRGNLTRTGRDGKGLTVPTMGTLMMRIAG